MKNNQRTLNKPKLKHSVNKHRFWLVNHTILGRVDTDQLTKRVAIVIKQNKKKSYQLQHTK